MDLSMELECIQMAIEKENHHKCGGDECWNPYMYASELILAQMVNGYKLKSIKEP
jgi:hypothetical protein